MCYFCRYSMSPGMSNTGNEALLASSEAFQPQPLKRTLQCDPELYSPSSVTSDLPPNLSNMRQLLRSHEEDIVERVVQRLSLQNPTPHTANTLNPQTTIEPFPATLPIPPNPTLTRIAELEAELVQLREVASKAKQARETREHSVRTTPANHSTIPQVRAHLASQTPWRHNSLAWEERL